MEKDLIAKMVQSCFEANPTIVLGSGASMPHELPSMGDLTQYLIDEVKPVGSDEQDQWMVVCQSLDAGNHLENALEGITLAPSLLTKIVAATWNCVNEKDKALFFSMLSGDQVFPLGELLKGIFRSTARVIEVVTTNYDRVVEYACNSAGLLYQTGFVPGYCPSSKSLGQLMA